MPARQVPAAVSARHLAREQVLVVFGQHSIVTDHPKNYEGDDTGPAPVPLFLGGIASCKAVTIVRHARRKGYSVESVEVRIPSYTVETENAEGFLRPLLRVTRVETALEIKGNLTEAQRRELEWVAEHCPVSESILRGMALSQRPAVAAP